MRHSPLLMSARMLPRHRGFVLLEAAIALLLLSSTLLGIGLLVADSAREQRSAQFIGQAALLATDLADRMRTNRRALEATVPPGGTVPYVKTGTYTALTANSAITTPTCGGPFVAPAASSNLNTACATAQDIAAYDLAAWQGQVQLTLAGGAGAVVAGTGSQRTIVVAWTEPSASGRGVSDAVCSSRAAFLSAGPGVRCYVLDFRL